MSSFQGFCRGTPCKMVSVRSSVSGLVFFVLRAAVGVWAFGLGFG